MIKVSDTAKLKINLLMQDDGFNPKTDFVRVGVKSGGCSGLSYDMDFVDQAKDGDQLFQENGIKVLVEKNTTIKISAIDKFLVGKVASEIKKLKPVEPYKGKGIKEKGQYVLRKEGKKK